MCDREFFLTFFKKILLIMSTISLGNIFSWIEFFSLHTHIIILIQHEKILKCFFFK